MFKLNILKQDPTLNLCSLVVNICALLNQVQLRDRLLWFFRCLQLFVLFNYCISSLKFSLMRFNLILRERYPTNLFEYLGGVSSL
jgi:hypothetical protein